MDWQLSKSPLPGIWVIEALAKSNQVDVSILLDLVEKCPQIADNLGKNARELVFLRILETFLLQGAQSDSGSSVSSPKISFYPSESCEDVLQHILLETSDVENLIPARPEMWEWDVQPFIEHKRSSLPTHALQKLKNAILTGNHSSLLSLKEQSGLPVGNQPEHGLQVDIDKCNGTTTRSEATGTNTRICERNDQLISPGLANSSNLLQNDSPTENLLPSHGNESATTEYIEGNSTRKHIISKNGNKIRIKFINKHKNDVLCSKQETDGKLTSSGVNEQRQDTSVVIEQHSERNTCSLEKDTYVGGIRLNEPPGNDINECISSKDPVDPAEVFPCKKQVSHFDSKLPNDKSVEEHGQENEIVKASQKESAEDMNKFESPIQLNIPDSSATDVRNLDMLADLCSRLVQSSEIQGCSLGKITDKGQIRNPRDGNYEFTSSTGLIVPDEVLHREKEILEPNENFDEEKGQDPEAQNAGDNELKINDGCMNQFPQTVQRNGPNLGEVDEISTDSDGHYDDWTDVATKKNAFMSSWCRNSQGSLATTDREELNVCVKCNKGGKLLVCSVKSCLLVIHESCLGSDASFSTGGEFYCPFCSYSRAISKYTEVKKKTSLARKEFVTFSCRGTRKESKDQHHGSSGINQLHLGQDDGLHESNELNKVIAEDINTHQVREKRNGGESGGVNRSKKRVLCSPQTDLPREYKCSSHSESADDQEISEENENSGTSKYFVRVLKGKSRNSFSSLPQLRRKRLPWTIAEEEKLKEGMRRFYGPDDRFIPWKKIQEFGAAVFHDSRSTIDLKDKWRNLCKASPKS